MDEALLDEKLLSVLNTHLSEIMEHYDAYIGSKFKTQAPKNDSLIFSILEKKTEEVKKSCIRETISTFKVACNQADIPIYKSVFKSIKDSIANYFDSAFSSFKSSYTSAVLRFRAENAESWLREQLFKEISHAKIDIAKFTPSIKTSSILVGKKRFSLIKYLNMVSENEIRAKFSMDLLKHATNTGAKGLKVSSHNTRCRLCAQFEGKVYNLPEDLAELLKDGCPPYHPNCKHFLVPIY